MIRVVGICVMVATLCIATGAEGSLLDLGGVAKIKTDSRLNFTVEANVRGRRSEVAASFLANPGRASRLTRRNRMTIPFDELADPYKAIVALRMFPEDSLTSDGVVHVVTLENETLARLSRIFTGTTRNSRQIRRAGTIGEVSVTRDHKILVTFQNSDVDDRNALARAVLKNPRDLARMRRGNTIVIPATAMKEVYRGAVLNHLFHRDTIRDDARRHKVVLNIETLFRIALWYTGNGDNWGALKRASHKRSNQVGMGETIVLPHRLLGGWAKVTEDDVADETSRYPLALTSRSRRGEIEKGQRLLIPKRYLPRWTRYLKDGEDGAQDRLRWFVYRGTKNGPLTYKADDDGGYAEYRLRRGEAIYSNVVVRFTGIMTGREVLALSREILRRSGYRDARRLPVNARIKVPMNMLSPDWRPEGDPARQAESEEATAVAAVEREISRERTRDRRSTSRRGRRALEGVTIILDAGHGGRDPGALGSGGVTENEVAYDIMCRVRKLLKDRTRARVLETIVDRSQQYRVSSGSLNSDDRDEYLKTTPNFANNNIVTSVNLRWYLSNWYTRQALRDDRSLDKVVFTSFHADALHSSVRGAMLYIPDAQYGRGRYVAKRSYRRYREVQTRPVSFSRNQRRRAQAMSNRLAERLIAEFRGSRIAVHGNKPTRRYIIRSRGRRPFVPAIIRFNSAPTKLLVEIGNIKNRSDLANMRSAQWRQRVAKAYVDAVIATFSD
jgi:N-acetylmuramoyl-L-alanine amidase